MLRQDRVDGSIVAISSLAEGGPVERETKIATTSIPAWQQGTGDLDVT
jgi:hypothetical protein